MFCDRTIYRIQHTIAIIPRYSNAKVLLTLSNTRYASIVVRPWVYPLSVAWSTWRNTEGERARPAILEGVGTRLGEVWKSLREARRAEDNRARLELPTTSALSMTTKSRGLRSLTRTVHLLANRCFGSHIRPSTAARSEISLPAFPSSNQRN